MAVADRAQDAAAPEISTATGRVRGERDGIVAVFRGIPFALPPVGDRRFAAPAPVPAWAGAREAVAFGPPPPQGGHFGMEALSDDGDGDWLTLNVWTAEPDRASRLPVLVWVQGGGYVIGTSGLPEYDGARLARENGVVVVTFNYRVGFEGFAQIEGAPANRGLLDQVAALEWVRDNVAAFGGDPERVTVFGQSAGAGSIAALLAMPRASGLFARAVVQSAPGTFFSPELAADIAAACAGELGLRATVADLSTVAPGELCLAADVVGADMLVQVHRWGLPAYRSIPFSPVVDGDVLPRTPWQALADGAGRGVELLVGHTRDEHRLFTALAGLVGDDGVPGGGSALDVLAPGPDGDRRYRDAYPGADAHRLDELVQSDWLFRMPTLQLADAQLAAGGHVHVYELTWEAPGMGGIFGACHGLDVPLVFGNLDRGQPAVLIGSPPSPEAESVSAAMRTAWTSFAADGDPGWPAYDAASRPTMTFDVEPAVTAYPEEASRLIWADHRFSALPLLDEPPPPDAGTDPHAARTRP